MDQDLTWSVKDDGGVVSLLVRGDLTRRTGTDLDPVVRKLLLDRGRLLVDVSAVRVRWAAAVAVFAAALANAGGWPLARLVLVDGASDVSTVWRSYRGTSEVSIAADRAGGLRALERRPRRVRRTSELPDGPGALAFARMLVYAACADWAIDEVGNRAVAVANELVTNAIEHVGGPMALALTDDERGLTVGVWDRSPTSPLPPPWPSAATGGPLGLRLVDEMSDRWGVIRYGDGKTVWSLISHAVGE